MLTRSNYHSSRWSQRANTPSIWEERELEEGVALKEVDG